MYLAQGYQTVTLVRIEPSTSRSGVQRSTTRSWRLPIFDEIFVTLPMASRLGLYCLPISQNLDTKLIWVKLSETREEAAK